MSAELTVEIEREVRQALAEDVGSGDVTAALIPADRRARAHVICRDPMVMAGRAWVEEVCRQVSTEITLHWHVVDGERVAAGARLVDLEGPARALLTAERTALNFLQTLAATATWTARHVEAVAGTGVQILDTRKTLPGLRRAQKYAVTCGGGRNHRMGLYDAILIKENHIMAAGSIAAAVAAARAIDASLSLEVEVESLDELEQALAAGADMVLLDNMPPDTLRQAVAMNQGRAKLEASGGVSLANLRDIAETGVDFISIGALTKDVRAIDLSMRFETDQL